MSESSLASASLICATCGELFGGSAAGRLCQRCSVAALDDVLDEGGLRISGYVLLGELAHGGMGAVYKARQLRPQREVAVKILLPQFVGDDEMLARFQIEARAMAALDHPGILPVYEVGESDGVPFFSMKLATGGSLAQRLAQGRLPPREAVELMEQLARALHFAHQHGVLHRDLKPANFLFDEAGRPYVSDFGLAKLPAGGEGAALTRTESFFGTPHYMPPEVAGGSVAQSTTAGDLYSLGAVLYECLAGCRPFGKHEGLGVLLRAIVDSPVPPLRSVQPNVPRDLEIICHKALEKSPAARYASCGDFADDLRCWLDGRLISARPVGPFERCLRWAKRHPLAAALAAALFAVSISGSLLLAKSYQDRGEALSLANVQLRGSYLNQARSVRLRAAPGYRRQALRLLQQAAQLQSGADLRSEAASVLVRADLEQAAKSQAPRGSSFSLTKAYAFPDDPPLRLLVEPQQRWAVSHHQSGRAALWHSGESSPVKTWEPAAGQAIVAEFFPDKLLLAGLEGGLAIYSAPYDGNPRFLQPVGSVVSFLAADPAETRVAVARADGLEVLSLVDGSVCWRAGRDPVRCRPAWNPEGTRLALAPGETRQIECRRAENGSVCWSAPTGAWPTSLTFHPAGTWLAAAFEDRQISLISASTGRILLSLEAEARELTFTRQGSWLQAADAEGSLREWLLCAPEAWHEWTGQDAGASDGTVFSLALSPDGRHLLTATTSGVRIWSVSAQREVGFHPAENQRIDAPTAAFWISPQEILVQVPGGLERVALNDQGIPQPAHPVKRPPGSSIAAIQPDASWIVRISDPDANEESWELWPNGDSARAAPSQISPTPQDPLFARCQTTGAEARLQPGDVLALSSPARMEPDLVVLPEMLGIRSLAMDASGRLIFLLGREHRVFSLDWEKLQQALNQEGF